jgi:site-specific DNA recombinase
LRRPGLDRLRDQVRAAAFDRVVITAPDRLAHNYVHQMLLIEELEQAGCQVEFIDRPMSQDPHDQLLLQIRGVDACKSIRLAVYCASTHAPYGYRVDPARPRDPGGVRLEPTEAAIVAEIFASYAARRAKA